jgi:hypothetical protein
MVIKEKGFNSLLTLKGKNIYTSLITAKKR